MRARLATGDAALNSDTVGMPGSSFQDFLIARRFAALAAIKDTVNDSFCCAWGVLSYRAIAMRIAVCFRFCPESRLKQDEKSPL
jgi:hypothetical protein